MGVEMGLRRARPGRPAVGRCLLAAIGAAMTVGLLGCATAFAGSADEVRVLVYDGASSVRIGPESGPLEVALQAGRLVVDGRPVGERWAPDGRGPWRVGKRTLRGRVSVRAGSGRIQVLNRVALEDYVASTVGGEMSPSWPAEALRAQAVAARTYVLHEAAKRRGRDWDVRATAASQVYRGIGAETKETRAATRATRGEVLTYRGEPILAVFHSTAGGRTATAEEVWGENRPYLRSIAVDEEEAAPHTYWRTEFALRDLAEILEASGLRLGGIDGISVTRRTRSGRVERLEIRGRAGHEELRGRGLRDLVSALGLRSTLFDVKRAGDGYAFVGSGYGHGVGMSQWGARAMAERGDAYPRILARFYPGTRLVRWSTRRLAAPHVGVGPGEGTGSRGEVR